MWQLVSASRCSSLCLIDADVVGFAVVVEAIDFHSPVCCSRSLCLNICAPIRVFVGYCVAVCYSSGFVVVVKLTVDVHLMLKYCVAMDVD